MRTLKESLINKSNIKNVLVSDIQEIKNPSYKDLITPGNVVVTKEKDDNVYLVLDGARTHFRWNSRDIEMVQPYNGILIDHIRCEEYKIDFPRFSHEGPSMYDIKKIFKTSINVNEIELDTDVVECFKKYNLSILGK